MQNNKPTNKRKLFNTSLISITAFFLAVFLAYNLQSNKLQEAVAEDIQAQSFQNPIKPVANKTVLSIKNQEPTKKTVPDLEKSAESSAIMAAKNYSQPASATASYKPERSISLELPLAEAPPFLLSSGVVDYCLENNRYVAWHQKCGYKNTRHIDQVIKDENLPLNAASIWITRNWQEEWFSAEFVNKNLVAKGITPIFIFYWYADDISQEFVTSQSEAIEKDLQRFTAYLQKIEGEKLVVLHPEFNQGDINQWQGFNDVLIKDMNLIRSVAKTKVGFCPGDFGQYKKSWVPTEWQSFHPSVERAAKEADFIAFQEMRALTRNDARDIQNTPNRSLGFARYLHETYQKPTLYAYLALSSYGENAEALQSNVIKETLEMLPEFKSQANLIGFNLFHLMDSPQQVGFFKQAEKHFGLYRADGSKKPSAQWLLEATP